MTALAVGPRAEDSGPSAAPAEKANPCVVLETDLGSIELQIDLERAPVTAANFLRHVDGDHFRGATFYRVVRDDNQPRNPVKIDVIQGGLGPDDIEAPFPPIEHETTEATGILHRDGVISMAVRGRGQEALARARRQRPLSGLRRRRSRGSARA